MIYTKIIHSDLIKYPRIRITVFVSSVKTVYIYFSVLLYKIRSLYCGKTTSYIRFFLQLIELKRCAHPVNAFFLSVGWGFFESSTNPTR